MDLLQTLVVACVQGFTEFLPISSSGHLVLVPALLGWSDQGLEFDVAVHLGTLFAVIVYFRKDVTAIIRDWSRSVRGGGSTVNSNLGWSILLTSAMIAVAGLVLEGEIRTHGRNPVLVAVTTIGFGVLMGIVDRFGNHHRPLDSLGIRGVLFIGLAQILALVPGTSRSGITITAGMMLGLTRAAAARFSFLMAIPVITMAGAWQIGGLASGAEAVRWDLLIVGMLVSAMVALLCIHYFLRFLERFTLMPFVVYRVVLGIILLAVFL